MRMNVQFDASLAAIECNSTPLMRISGFGFTFVMGTPRVGKSIDTSYAPSMATGTKVPISSDHAARANLVDAKKAAEMLGISIASLYSYVSRGKLGRTEDPKTGTSLFGVQEIEEFKSRRDRGKRPDQVAIASLDFGLPVLESGISTSRTAACCFVDKTRPSLPPTWTWRPSPRCCGSFQPPDSKQVCLRMFRLARSRRPFPGGWRRRR